MEWHREITLQTVECYVRAQAETMPGALEKLPWSGFIKVNCFKLFRGEWKAEEDRKLLELVLDLGKKWSGIAKQLKTRTEHSVKNRFRSLIKKFSKNIPGQKKPRKKSTKDLELVKGIIQEMDKT